MRPALSLRRREPSRPEMPNRTSDDEDSAQGQYLTVSSVLLAVGALGVMIGGPLTVLGIRLPLVEPESLAVTGAIVGSVGAVMRLAARGTE